MNLDTPPSVVRKGQVCGTSLLLALTLSACGGSSGDGPSNTSVGTSPGVVDTGGGGSANAHRITRMRYDLDNNGTIDSVRTFSYNADGRVVAEHYTYTGDGSPDTDFRNFSIDAPSGSQTTNYTYDSSGLLQLWSIVDASGARTDSRYEYGNDKLIDRYTIDTFNAAGGLTGTVYFQMDNMGTRLTDWRLYVDGNSTPSQNAALTYNAGGQVQSDLLTVATAGTQTLTTYAYNAAGRIQSVRQSTPSNSAFFSEHAYTYSSANTLSAIIATGNSANDIYRWDYTVNSDGLNTEWRIDLDSNQTVEAIVYIDWESGPCLQTFIWAPRAHPNFVAGGNVPYAPGSGYAVLPTCGP